MTNEFYPIAAISTPYGRGGIAVIRMSGSGCIEAAEKFFIPKSGKKASELSSNTAVYGDILSGGEIIDNGLITIFRAPRSYTGEDTVEISCHGGITLARTVLESAYICGCRPAEAGEFTKRAFINGKLSLSQAEAVAGLIDAKSKEALKLSSAQSRGILSRKISRIGDRITTLLASVYAGIDYPDEDLAELSTNQLKNQAEEIYDELSKLSDTYRAGKAVCEGIETVIIGKPNTGKSSLMNLLLGEERAIVTEAAGTTRDTIEETVNVGRVLLRLCDTAGLRDTDNKAERLGIERAREKLGEAGLILAVFDGSCGETAEDTGIIKELLEIKKTGRAEIIPLVSKCDLLPQSGGDPCIGAQSGATPDNAYDVSQSKAHDGTKDQDGIQNNIKTGFDNIQPDFAKADDNIDEENGCGYDCKFDLNIIRSLGEPIFISSVTGENSDKLIRRISDLFVSGDISYSENAVIANARQYASVCEAKEHVGCALSALEEGLSQDIAGLDLEAALSRLMELDGRQTASDITDKIFASFCVGK